jgi:hypothetical protein
VLFSELQALTHNEAEYDEFLAVEKLYMADEAMTKLQAASLWSMMFGPASRYKSQTEAAYQLTYRQLSRLWSELFIGKIFECKDAETKLRFTFLSWQHPKLNRNVLTLTLLLRKGTPKKDPIIMPLPMTDIGDDAAGIWLHPSTPGIIILHP